MKALLFVLFSIFLNVSFAQTHDDWTNLSKDYCKGMNKLVKKVSEASKNAIITSANTGEDLQTLFVAVANDNLKQFEKDVDVLQDLPSGVMELAFKLNKKYSDVLEGVEVNEVNRHYLIELESLKGCEFARALVIIGMQEMDEEPETEY